MKKLLVLALVSLLAAGAWRLVRAELRTNLELNAKVAGVVDMIDGARSSVSGAFNGLRKKLAVLARRAAMREPAGDPSGAEAVTVYLKHGGVVSGRLLEKKPGFLAVEWKGDRFELEERQIARVEYKTARDIEWPYENSPVVVKTDGAILDGVMADVASDRITLSFPQGGGSMEMTVRRADIDHLLFAPDCGGESLETERRLRSLFPKMKVYKDGNITLFTDSYATVAGSYRKALRNFYTEVYLKFFKLFKGRRPARQCFVVAFDDFGDYVEYALTDGVPGWLAIGYFSPSDRTLYVFNAFGERMEKMVFDVMVGKTGRSLDSIVDFIKKQVDARYHVFIEGQAKEISDRFWDAYSLYKSELNEMTASTMRHEFAHEIFNNWGFQSIILSRPDMDKKRMAAKKREFLDTKDYRKKEELLMTLMRLRKEEYEGTEVEAAQSWLSEGVATYCETDPVGSVNEGWLFAYQDAASRKETNPIEFLTSFKVGSFPGLCHKAKLASYAQSWALTSFLMARYPDSFMAYQIRFATQRPRDQDEELDWLLKATGKDLPALEKEFADYMRGYPPVEDPDVKRFMRYYKIWEDLLVSG